MAIASNRPVVDVPSQAEDRPFWTRVGAIALVGFVVGIAWPRFAGVRLGPTPPDEKDGKTAASASASSASRPPSASASIASSNVSAPPASAPLPAVGAPAAVAIGPARVLSCRNAKGKALDACDSPELDSVLGPRLRAVAQCPAAAGLAGKLSIGFDLDFQHNRAHALKGKSTTLPGPAVSSILQCVETQVQKVSLEDVSHQHSRYTVFYSLQFSPPGGPAAQAAPDNGAQQADSDDQRPKETSVGSGQVVYDTVLVRDQPKEGKVIARLVRGTRVELLSSRGGWYKIRFGDREGWAYRGSIAQEAAEGRR